MSKAFKELGLDAMPLAGAMPAFCVSIPATELRGICEQARARKARLVALWGSDESTRRAGYALHLALAFPSGLLWVSVPLSREDPYYPGIADVYPSANRMQRAAADLLGIIPSADADRRKWLRHGAWPEGAFPLRKNVEADARFAQGPDRYPFVPVEGEGVHEIPVGPVHAGTIEPGHFRFSIVGEKILRLEERLGYKHKGIEKRFEQMTLEEGAKLAGRVSGDSTVAYAWAYAMAAQSAPRAQPPPPAPALRGIPLHPEPNAHPHLAERMGLTGLAGRASGIARDLRVDYAIPPYQQLDPRAASHTRGDVAARVAVRFDEVFESMRLVQALVQQLPPGDIRAPLAAAAAGARGLGWIEGWRGEVLIALGTAAANRIRP